MTAEKAIDILCTCEKHPDWKHTGGMIEEACRIVSALKLPPNDPLTLKELREMDGEQVWIDQPDGSKDCSGWARVELAAPWKPGRLKPHVFVVFPNGNRDYAGLLLECGDKIYRRKPEEEIT